MPLRTCVFVAAALSSALSAPGLAHAADARAPSCTVRAQSDALVVMVCPPTAGAPQWRAAAESACKARTTCNVWIWDDALQAPAEAPASDEQLPKSMTRNAVAVWANDSKSLINLRRVAPR